MRIFGRAAAPPVDEAALAAAEEEHERSREQIRAGGLPVRAERRLRELAANEGFYTSDLSVAEFALCKRAGLRPISQVMGSCVYHVGWFRQPGARWGAFQAQAFEVEQLSQAWNDARSRALDRLRQEAVHCGADAVVGVHIHRGHRDFETGAIEFVAIGTAVRLDAGAGTSEPALTNLSVQDYFKLVQAGYRAHGIAGGSTVYYVIPSWQTRRVQGSRAFGPGSQNQELPEFTRALYNARETALHHASAAAARLGADGLVGVTIDQSQRTIESGDNSSRRDLQVTLHVLATAISSPAQPRTLEIKPAISLG